MKKSKKRIYILVAIVLCVIAAVGIITFNILQDTNRLTVEEKQWITDNTGSIQNVNIVNNVNNFGVEGTGVFFEFLEDFSKEHNLNINPITYNKDENPKDIAFKISSAIGENDLVFFRDHFVLISKTDNVLRSIKDFEDKKIGVLKTHNSYVSNYLNLNNLTLKEYEKDTDLFSALNSNNDINFIIIPQNEYMDKILTDNYFINFHIGDIPLYYSLQLMKDNRLSDVMRKFYNDWIDTKYDKSYNKHNLDLFIKSLNIVQKDQDTLTSREFNYGFIENSPYEVIMSGNYGGIISSYLKKFSDFSNVEFKFNKYKNIDTLNTAINSKELDIYFNSYDTANEYKTVPTQLNVEFSILAKKDNDITINSLKTLSNKEVYVLNNSTLATHLNALNYLKVVPFNSYKELFKTARKNDILIAVDTNIFNYYQDKQLSNYTSRYQETLTQTYNFKTNANDTFNNLFSKYINSLDPDIMINRGLYNHEQTVRQGNLFSAIAKYSLYFILLAIIIILLLYRSSKRIKLVKKIRKEDKIKYIDQLTSLKNRNYLNENIDSWNKNTIYPQACIVVDLNKVQEINDTLGYDQGDAQIKSAANVLIKTQLDNSDIIRTDGNEFLIYLVGYEEKQVASYIRKLYKELKNLPFDYGAAMGRSMIIDDLKTIEDAINEAVEAMKIDKEEKEKEE